MFNKILDWIIENFEFEYFLATVVFGTLIWALVYFPDIDNIVIPIISFFTTAGGVIIGYFFKRKTEKVIK